MLLPNHTYMKGEKAYRLSPEHTLYEIPGKFYALPKIPSGLLDKKAEGYLDILKRYLFMPVLVDDIADAWQRRELRQQLQRTDKKLHEKIEDNAIRSNTINNLLGIHLIAYTYQGSNPQELNGWVSHIEQRITTIRDTYIVEKLPETKEALKKHNQEKIRQVLLLKDEIYGFLQFLSRQTASQDTVTKK